MLPHIFAYLDPGSGAMIAQALVASLIALPIIFRNKIRSVVHRVQGGSHGSTTVPEGPPTGTTRDIEADTQGTDPS